MNILKAIDSTWFWKGGHTFEYTIIEELDDDDNGMGFFCIADRGVE